MAYGKGSLFFYFYPSRYFGAGPDSDLMMAPDDGSSIMTHPEGKEKKVSVWLFYCSCNPTVFISAVCRDTLIQLADLFFFLFSLVIYLRRRESSDDSFSHHAKRPQASQGCLVVLGHSLTTSHSLQKIMHAPALKVGQVWHTGVFGEADST